jgi:hypothetical protein
MQRMGFWKPNPTDHKALFNSNSRGSLAGEGSTFFVLYKQPFSQDNARISGICTFYKPSGNEDIEKRIAAFLDSKNIKPNDLDLLILGNSGDYRLDAPFRFLQHNLFSKLPYINFKHLCGEYQTASAFALWLGTCIIKHNKVPAAFFPSHLPANHAYGRILIYNHYRNINHSLILLER